MLRSTPEVIPDAATRRRHRWNRWCQSPPLRRQRALALSIARYLVMLTQFVMALQAFRHLADWMWMDQMVHQTTGGALTWGLTSLAPVPLLGDLGLREAAALWRGACAY